MGSRETDQAKLPPAWFKPAFRHVHRALRRELGGRSERRGLVR